VPCCACTPTYRLTTHPLLWLCSHRIRPAGGFPIVTARDEVIERMCAAEEDHAFELELILEAYTRQASFEMSTDAVHFFFGNLENVAYNARRLASWLRVQQATGQDRVGTLFLTQVRTTAAAARLLAHFRPSSADSHPSSLCPSFRLATHRFPRL
jgi:hypothetical protein